MNLKRLWRKIAILLTVVLLAVPVLVVDAAPGQKGPPDDKGRPGDKGPPPGLVEGEEPGELGNNLSVPAIFVAGNPFPVDCSLTAADLPENEPITGYEAAGYYYVQGTHVWQAQCTTTLADTVDATAAWGDNLTGAPLKSGTPIRVEIGLMENGTLTDNMEGFNVVKLQPSLADRYSAYGILASGDPTNGFSAPVVTNTEWGRVYDHEATFSIQNVDTLEYEVVPGTTMTAEINSTGKVVYGFNWGVSEEGVKDFPPPGTYLITFKAPNVNITGVSAGVTTNPDIDTATITVEVGNKGGKGGGGGGKGPKPQAETYFGDQLLTQDRIQDRDGTCLLP